MVFINFRNLFHLRWQKIALLLCLGLCFSAIFPANAQNTVVRKNLPDYDNRLMRYGFFLAMPVSTYKIEHSEAYVNQFSADSSFSVNSRYTPNFSTGFVVNMNIAQYFSVRFLPGVGFYSREVEYDGVPDPETGERTTVVREVGSTMIELPLMLKYTSKRRRNVRMYFVGGAKASVDVSNRKRDRIENQLRAEPNDFSIEYGVGVDLFYPFFKFAPELRFSHGLSNMRVPDDNIYARSIDKMNTHSVTLYLFFE